MNNWEAIAATLQDTLGFITNKGSPAIKTRFETIVRLLVSEDLASLRKPETQEKYSEREKPLEDIIQRTSDFAEVAEEQRSLAKEKQTGIEASGLVARRLAVQSMDMSPDDFVYDSSESNDVDGLSQLTASSSRQDSTPGTSTNKIDRAALPTPVQKSRTKRARASNKGFSKTHFCRFSFNIF